MLQFESAASRNERSDGLSFVAHGSTSFILASTVSSHGVDRRVALKCVLLPYATSSAIADATDRYAEDYGARASEVKHMVRVWASSPRWILMDLVQGHTLSTEIGEQLKEHSEVTLPGILGKRTVPLEGNVRIDVINRLAPPLLAALHELHLQGRVHEDLSPDNILVQRDESSGQPRFQITFIDFGRNYLNVGYWGRGNESKQAFAAPEIRENREVEEKERWLGDVYSLGRLLIAMSAVTSADDSTVPDRMYGQTPLLARVVEDLIDSDPARRLLVFNKVRRHDKPYAHLREILLEEVEATRSSLDIARPDDRARAVPVDRTTAVSTLRGLAPVSREPARRRRIYLQRSEQGLIKDNRRSLFSRWLLGFSLLASVNVAVCTLICVLWLYRDIGIDILNPGMQVGFRILGLDPDQIPFVDNLRVDDYRLGDLYENLPARIVGLSFALTSARYYQNILGGFTARVANSPEVDGPAMRYVTELVCRVMAIWSFALILGCNLVAVSWWPIATAIGYTGVLAANLASARFADDYLTRAYNAGLSTIPRDVKHVTGLESYRAWGPSMFVYVIVVWLFAIPIYTGALSNEIVFALLVCVVNIGLFYVIKTGKDALDIRSGLMRSVLAAERLRCWLDSRDPSLQGGRDPAPVAGN